MQDGVFVQAYVGGMQIVQKQRTDQDSQNRSEAQIRMSLEFSVVDILHSSVVVAYYQ